MHIIRFFIIYYHTHTHILQLWWLLTIHPTTDWLSCFLSRLLHPHFDLLLQMQRNSQTVGHFEKDSTKWISREQSFMYSFSSHDSRLLVQENPPDLTVRFLAHGIIYCAFLSFFRLHNISHILSCVMTGLLWVYCTGPGVWTQARHPQSWDGPGLRLFFNCPTGRWSSECSEHMLQWLGKKNEKTKYHKEKRLANKMHPRLLTPVDVFGTCGNAADSGGWSLCAAAFKVHLFFPFAEPFSKTRWKLHPSSVEGCMQEY